MRGGSPLSGSGLDATGSSAIGKIALTKSSRKKPLPFPFVIEALEPLSPVTRPMFGCTAVYVGDRIVFALRNKVDEPEDNGVWLATSIEHHESLAHDFPSMRSIGVLGPPPTGWQILPSMSEDFEESALRACEMVISGDKRIGKVPRQKKLKPAKPRT
jgi:hypothetical protein